MSASKLALVVAMTMVCATLNADPTRGSVDPKWSSPVQPLHKKAPRSKDAPQGKRVRINSGSWDIGQHVMTGDTVPASLVPAIYYLDEPCELPFVNREEYRYFYNTRDHKEGCWGLTMDGGYTVYMKNGLVDHSEINEEVHAQGILYPDNSVKITEPNFNSDTWVFAVMKHQTDKMRENIYSTDKQR